MPSDDLTHWTERNEPCPCCGRVVRWVYENGKPVLVDCTYRDCEYA